MCALSCIGVGLMCGASRTDSLSKTVKNEGQKPRWSPQDAYILVHKLVSTLTCRCQGRADHGNAEWILSKSEMTRR